MTYSIIQTITNNYDVAYDNNDLLANNCILFTDVHKQVKNYDQHIISNVNKTHPFDDIFSIRWQPFDYVDTDYSVWLDRKY